MKLEGSRPQGNEVDSAFPAFRNLFLFLCNLVADHDSEVLIHGCCAAASGVRRTYAEPSKMWASMSGSVTVCKSQA
jgi:hypothetical protein